MMTASLLRQKYLEFFRAKGHTVIPSAPLVPANDPTVLFTTAGMHPLVPYLLGEAHPGGGRLTSVQKCIRTVDIDDVGDATHNTFFEMLGNWSLGDYWKKEAIEWSYEFLTSKEWLGIDVKRLAVSVFAGDKDAPRDDESAEIWKALGIPEERIAYLSKEDNWWGPAGITGPCGPDTEMFYWTGEGEAPVEFDAKDKRWFEIWNDVFMQYNKTIDGKYEPLKQKNVDTGMGLERTAAALQGKDNVYDTDLFLPIISKILSLTSTIHEAKQIPLSVYPRGPIGSDIEQAETRKWVRIIADHLKAATFMIADGVVPSNKDRGYVLRRLIRRAVRYGQLLGIENEFCTEVAAVVIHNFSAVYSELVRHQEKIIDEFAKEDLKFRKTLARGLKRFDEVIEEYTNDKLSDKELWSNTVFDLYQTYGFPFELIKEIAREKGVSVDEVAFKKHFEKHQDLSRTASAGTFKGGLADHTDEVVRLHTATHLMLAALREVLGDNVMQKGSNITKERARFDFTHNAKLTDEQKKEIEKLVNNWIDRDLSVKKEVLSLEEARSLGAIGMFGEKYGAEVSVYTIFDPKNNEIISREFCGGPHVKRTGEIGRFAIQKEEAVASGVRRIKATV